MNNKIWETMRSAFLSGICIGIAGFGFLAEKNIIGEVLFCFGLLTVVHYGLKLYTGTAGFIKKNEFGYLCQVLVGNWIGCLAIALMARCSAMPLQETAQGILEGRLAMGPIRGAILAIGCGFIMTTCVNFSRQDKNLPLFFGVPLFIVCGFPHCVADAFYYMCVPVSYLAANWVDVLIFYAAIVVGNFVGCNLYRGVMELMEFAPKPAKPHKEWRNNRERYNNAKNGNGDGEGNERHHQRRRRYNKGPRNNGTTEKTFSAADAVNTGAKAE